jgi:hypothetical protein
MWYLTEVETSGGVIGLRHYATRKGGLGFDYSK